MCELLGLSSRKQIEVNGYLRTFYSHSERHCHGWGLALFYGDAVSLEKEAICANQSHHLIDQPDEALQFAAKVGYPVIVKPDNGVGASNTWKVGDEASLKNLYHETLAHYPAHHFIMEEFVPGHIETFDGITDAQGNIVFYTGQVMMATPLAMLQGTTLKAALNRLSELELKAKTYKQ